MDKALLEKYRKRFEAVGIIEQAELKKLSFRAKFQQLLSVFSLGKGLGFGIGRNRISQSLNSNWASLKDIMESKLKK